VRSVHPSSPSIDNCDRSELSDQTRESLPGRLGSQRCANDRRARAVRLV
jgi:hypothetical protein